MNFEIGQVFEGEYPPEAAIWCNEIGKVHIEEIEPVDDVQRFQIQSRPMMRSRIRFVISGIASSQRRTICSVRTIRSMKKI